jgi:hypothetical protein
MFPTPLIRNAGDLFLFLRILVFSASVPVLMRLKLVRLDTLLLALKPSVFSLSLRTCFSLRSIRDGRSGPYDRKRFFVRCPFRNALLAS